MKILKRVWKGLKMRGDHTLMIKRGGYFNVGTNGKNTGRPKAVIKC